MKTKSPTCDIRAGAACWVAILWLGWSCGAAEPLKEIWVVQTARMSPAEQVLLATLQGVANKTNAHVWVRAPGMSEVILKEMELAGVRMRTPGSVWDLLKQFQPAVRGAILCDLKTESLNAATSLCGPRQAIAVDISLAERIKAAGIPVLLDARSLSEQQTLARFGKEFARRLVMHQPIQKRFHLRDFAVARDAFVFANEDPKERVEVVQQFGPAPLVYGWGKDELEFVEQVSRAGGAVVPADWALNFSAFQHLPTKVNPLKTATPEPARAGERVVAFVMSDGDNMQWMMGGFPTSKGFWASPHRGKFPMTWELAPTMAETAPRALDYLYRTASQGLNADDFVTGPSGVGYYFPHVAPDRLGLARATATSTAQAGLSVVSVLNSGGNMEETREILEQPEVAGVIYKDYAPYNKRRGAVFWHNGKPCVSYRFLLWEPEAKNSPQGVGQAIEKMPRAADRDSNSYALINVHAWSFRKMGGPMEAVRRTIELLPPNTRVVTASQLVQMLKMIQRKED